MSSRVSSNPPRPVTSARVEGPATPEAARPAASARGATAPASGFDGTVRPAADVSGADGARAQAKLDAVTRLLKGDPDFQAEGRIVDIFRGADAKELNYLVTKLDLHQVFGELDQTLLGPDARTQLMTLLCRERLPELSVGARVALVNGLQKGSTDALRERGIRDVFLGTTGRELTALKNGVDAGNDYHDLQQLLFHDLDDPKLQAEILKHFQQQAVPTGEAKVLSDIDDTFYVNLKDKRFPEKTVYPGVVAFYAELDKGGGSQPGRAGDLAFVTARPNDRLGLVEAMTQDTLTSHGVKESVVLSGDLVSNLSHDAIAKKKFENFTQYRQLFPEYGFVFTGDSGQGDVLFGARMRAAHPGEVKAIFINDVVATPQAKRDEYRAQGVYFTDTYVGAGVEAFKLGLVSREGLGRIVAAAKADLAKVAFTDDAQKAARQAELDRDVALAQAALAT